MPLTKGLIQAAASIRIRHILDDVEPEPEPPEADSLLLESGDHLLLESGDRLLLE